jgi:hypothetical protein
MRATENLGRDEHTLILRSIQALQVWPHAALARVSERE